MAEEHKTEPMLVAVNATKKRVLIVEDDEDVARAQKRTLERFGWDVVVAGDVSSAAKTLISGGATVVLCDINLPGASGVELLSMVRSYDVDVPVLLITGNPTVQTAIDAVQLGAVEYLTKPIDGDVLNARLERAHKLGQLARLKRDALRAADASARPGDLFATGVTFERALAQMFLVYQPIFDIRRKKIFAYEALMRSRETEMQSPMAILDAARRLDRFPELGRRVRSLIDASLESAPADALVFVNLHASDLVDPTLYAAGGPLVRQASRIVLEITERSSLETIKEPRQRARELRALGFRLAIDDLGAGYAGLTSFALLEPEIVKLDMTLVRGVDKSSVKRHLIESMVALSRSLNMQVVAEGIETPEELVAVRELGCDFGQGFGLGRPAPEFARPVFPG
jgi:EAL domain-containing protein (putative c-di-GMP-specific phosphodiesterase class I)